MFNNKHVLCSLIMYRFNIANLSRRCSRNLSFANAIYQKLKVEAELEVLEVEYKGDNEDTRANAQCCDNTLTTNSQINIPPKIGTECMKKFQDSINYKIKDERISKETFLVSNNTAVDKIIPMNTLTTEKKYDTSNNSYVQLRHNKKTPFVDNNEKITSYPILGSSDVITNPTSGRLSRIPSVTMILRETMSPTAKTNLTLWKEQMIEEFGNEEFEKHCKEALRTGRLLHFYIQNMLQCKDVPLIPEIELAYHSVRPFLSQIRVQKLETHVTHPKLMYKGIIDCIAIYRDELCVIDWKKSDKKRSTLASTYDAPLQISAYVGAVNATHLLPFMVTKGLIVVAYTNGDRASVYEIQDNLLQRNWQSWLKRLKKFYENPKNKVFTEA